MNRLILWFNKTGSPPLFDRFAARWAPWSYALAFVLLAIGIYGALYAVPADYKQWDPLESTCRHASLSIL